MHVLRIPVMSRRDPSPHLPVREGNSRVQLLIGAHLGVQELDLRFQDAANPPQIRLLRGESLRGVADGLIAPADRLEGFLPLAHHFLAIKVDGPAGAIAEMDARRRVRAMSKRPQK